ncbi:MAG TPA: tRNA (adenosine(37)-N6)-dimethylallyltransferase MiaA [Chthoniobacterales bacterium]|nr:tRNA (adenosine(37)-N6)-dimethylallyltransferase MiaA [Chthoniobacterales bacterium]
MKRIFFIVGPTATGKSEIAADVAVRSNAEIVSADAFQIYRGLPLLTAQPDEATLRKAPHHLIATVPLSEEMSAEKFRALALSAIEEINRRGKLALIVGGSGLYLKALTHGLAPLPAVDRQLRADLSALSLEELNTRLRATDPLGAEKIDRRNKRRVVRALEIFAQTNSPASAQRVQWQNEPSNAPGVLVFRERPDLYRRVDTRVEETFQAGVTEEVAAVSQLSATAAQMLGFNEIRELLAGKISLADCIETIQQASRRYAKRQLTWFRRQTNLEPLNLTLLKDHTAAVDWILQKLALLPPLE